ncbi:hypothetical protein MTR_7g091010 [Medicago truncatula]|uniref:BRCT domain-containing protein n=1 Tax=Medicago truncatula TaxID=3880 RepID=G7KSM6_MEDTR|nr:hypothetical protein MTR_7g091010 [Medicago truncatula]
MDAIKILASGFDCPCLHVPILLRRVVKIDELMSDIVIVKNVLAPEYKAKDWSHINIVTVKWFDESIAQRACLNEESYPVQSGSLSSNVPLFVKEADAEAPPFITDQQ